MQIRSSLSRIWRESRANPGFTLLYLGGVAFAVAFTMLYAIIYYVNLAPIYPEYNRSLTSYSNYVQIRNDSTKSTYAGLLSRDFIKDFIENSENIEYCSYNVPSSNSQSIITPPNGKQDFSVPNKYTDSNFFKLYEYEFIAGRPFNEVEVNAEMPLFAVLTESIAERLYGSAEEAIGKEATINYKSYRIVGVVRRGTPIAYNSYAEIFMPYTLIPSGERKGNLRDYRGQISACIKFKDSKQRELFEKEFADKINRTHDSDGFHLNAKLQSHVVKTLGGDENLSSKEILKTIAIMLAVLLIVPAINISGMISGQMDRRMAEIGIRRSFGATRGQLTSQVMFENFVLTLTGGLLGLLIAWIIIVFCRQWMLNILINAWEMIDAPIDISAEMLFSPAIFISTLLLCLLLNTLSAYIPVRLSLRRQIVTSLNSNR